MIVEQQLKSDVVCPISFRITLKYTNKGVGSFCFFYALFFVSVLLRRVEFGLAMAIEMCSFSPALPPRCSRNDLKDPLNAATFEKNLVMSLR